MDNNNYQYSTNMKKIYHEAIEQAIKDGNTNILNAYRKEMPDLFEPRHEVRAMSQKNEDVIQIVREARAMQNNMI